MKIIYFSYIYFYLIKLCINYIVYPLKIYNEYNNIKDFLSIDSTFTTLEIGTPPQKVNFFFNLNHTKINLTDIGCKDNNLYYRNNSKTFKIVYELEEEFQSYNTKYLVIDSLYFPNNINISQILKIKEYPLYYSSDITNNHSRLCGNIGLSVKQYELYMEEPYQIKYYTDYIKSMGADQDDDFSFFYYNNQDYLIYGIFLHLEFKDIFKEVRNIAYIHTIIKGFDYTSKWEIKMKEYYYNDIHTKDNSILFEINPLFEFIVGTNDYNININNDFFKSYINKNICSLRIINSFTIYECNRNKFGKSDIIKFPTLHFTNIDINHIFEMTGEDLFIELNNIYYFKIIFPEKNTESKRWILGKIFLRKYNARFCPSSRMIGFYIKPNGGAVNKTQIKEEKKIEEKINNNNKESFFSTEIFGYIKIIIIALIFTCLGLYIGKKIFFPRRKRANELIDDYYQYDSKSNKNNDKENKKDNKSFTSIEMNSKLGIK